MTTAPVARRATRRLQWLTVVVGFLFFVSLLADAALFAIGHWAHPFAVLVVPSQPARDVPLSATQTIMLVRQGATVLLGGLAILLAGACLGRYRALVALSAALLALGVAARLLWSPLLDILLATHALQGLPLLGRPLLPLTGSGEPWLTTDTVPLLPWFLLAPALGLTLLGLLGLILVGPRRGASRDGDGSSAAEHPAGAHGGGDDAAR